MESISFRLIILSAAFNLLTSIITIPSLSAQQSSSGHGGIPDTASISKTLGAPGSWNASEGVYKVSFPRNDIKIKVDGITLPPFMGLTTWFGFEKDGNATMVMGDMVLFQDEVNQVMSILLDGGMAVSALHNHFFYSDPTVYFMHIGGDGKEITLAGTIKAALDQIKSIRAAFPSIPNGFAAQAEIDSSDLSASNIDPIIRLKGTSQKGMLKYSVGRTVKMPGGHIAGNDMGVNSWAGLMGTSGRAVIDGDFATSEGELQPVLKALRHAGINIVAIHSHMEGEVPHIIFLHFWGVGPAADLAQGFRSALDAQAASLKSAK